MILAVLFRPGKTFAFLLLFSSLQFMENFFLELDMTVCGTSFQLAELNQAYSRVKAVCLAKMGSYIDRRQK